MSKGLPGRAWYALVFLLAGIAGGCFLHWREAAGLLTIPVLAHPLPSYKPIESSDLTTLRVKRRKLTQTAVTDAKQLLGRYGFSRLQPGVALDAVKLGPVVNPQTLRSAFIAVVPLPAFPGLDAGMDPGAFCDLVFTGADAPPPIPRVVVLNVGPKQNSAVLAIPMERRSDFARAAGRQIILAPPVPSLSAYR